MSFNEENTIENALRDHLCAKVASDSRMVNEDPVPYGSSFIPHHSPFPPWRFIHGDDLVLHGKQPQDVFVETWLKEALCRLNPIIGANPDLADEVIHRLRGVLLDASYSGLIRANEIFHEWLLGKNSKGQGVASRHCTRPIE